MALSPESFCADIGRQPLAPVYLIAGDELLRVQEAADAVRNRARAEGYVERVICQVDDRFDWNELAYELSAPSLFSPRRVFDVRLPSGKPGKEGAAALESLLDQAHADNLLLIVAHSWSSKHGGRWSERIAQVGVFLPCPLLRRHELPEWLGRRLRQRGLSASRAAIEVLVERVEGNLLAAAQEIDKLALLAPGAQLDADSLLQLVADSARYDVFVLFDAAMAGDVARAERVLAGLKAEGEQVLALMGWIAGEIKRIARYAAIADAGGDVVAAMREDRLWESRQALYRRALHRHAADRWLAMVEACARIDLAAKGRTADDPWRLLARLIAALADARAARDLLRPC